MLQDLEKFGKIAAILAFVFCFVGGLIVILSAFGILFNEEGFIWAGVGLYFIGKSFFVGPMLLIASRAVQTKA